MSFPPEYAEHLVFAKELFRVNEELRKNINSMFWNFFVKWKTAITEEEEIEVKKEYEKLILRCHSYGMSLPEWFTETSVYKDELCQ